MTRIAFDQVRETVTRAFVRAGMNEADASACATIHTESSCDGIYSHGLNRVARFVDYIHKGWVDLDAKPSRVKALGAIEIWDGNFGVGILNAIAAVDRAMAIAQGQGVGIVGLRNTTHWMRGGTYGWRAAERGFVAICWTNTEAVMPAWGGKNSRVGNNPFVIAVPRKAGPLVLDMAMSQYSYGKLQVTRPQGRAAAVPRRFRQGREPHLRTRADRAVDAHPAHRLLEGFGARDPARHAGRGTDRGHRNARHHRHRARKLRWRLAGVHRLRPGQVRRRRCRRRHCRRRWSTTCIRRNRPRETAARAIPGESQLATRIDHRANGIVVDDGVWAEILQLAGTIG